MPDIDAEQLRRELKDQLKRELKDELKLDEAAFEKKVTEMIAAITDILADNNAAILYTIKFLGDFVAEMNARGQMLGSAIREFNEFLKLPPKSSVWEGIFNAAFAVISSAIPALRLTPWMQQLETKAGELAAIAKASPPRLVRASTYPPGVVDRVIHVAPKADQIAQLMNSANSSRQSLQAAFADRPDGIKALRTLDSSKGPVLAMIKYANRAMEVYGKALDALSLELKNRLHDPTNKPKKSLEALARETLPPLPKLFTGDEVDQLGLQYKWEILKAYASENVAVITYPDDYGNRTEIEGLNDTQREQIVDWFGPPVIRGKYFTAPITINIWYALRYWAVKRKPSYARRSFQRGWANN